MFSIQRIKHQLMAKSRKRKYDEFIQRMSLTPETTILDVGVADREHSPYDNYLEKRYPYPSQITALSIQNVSEFNKRYPLVNTVIYGGGRFPFQDKEFSVIHSNAVIEHVGNHERQLDFINEIARCGERFYFSTPAREFLIEIHTNRPIIHWLPKRACDHLLTKSGKAWAAGDYMHLLTKSALRKLMQQAQINEYQIITHHLFGMPYQYVVFGKS